MFPTKDAADRHQRNTRTAIENQTFSHDRGVTVAEWLEEWVTRKETSGRKVTTTVGYRSIIDHRLTPMIGKHRIGNLRPNHVQAMLDQIASDAALRLKNEVGKPVGATTVRNVRAVLRAALNDAVKRGLVARNVALMVDLPPVRHPDPVSVSSDRLWTFLDYVEGDLLEALWLMDVVYGVRRGELLGTRWPDVDSDRHLIRVRWAVLEPKGTYACPFCAAEHHRTLFDTVKTRSGERVLPLVPEVEAALMAHRLRQDHERSVYGADYADHGLVFARPDGNPWKPSWISGQFKRHMVNSGASKGMERVPSLKALRSTMVTALHEEGVSLEVVSRVAGHAGTRVTDEHYLSVTAERTRREIGRASCRERV
jgi:integrase